MKNLFKRYQKPLVEFANTRFGKDYLDDVVKTIQFPIVGVAPNALTYKVDKNRYVSRFVSKNLYTRAFADILTSMHIAEQHGVSFLDSDISKKSVAHFGCFKQHNDLPQIYLVERTYNPDADPESTSVDGHAGVNGLSTTNWGTVRSTAGNIGVDSSASITMVQIREASSNYTDLFRGFLLFDTTGIPISNNNAINSAKISIYGSSKTNGMGNSPDTAIFSSNPASNTAIVSSDKNNVGTTAFSGVVTFASFNTSAYNDYTFNSTGINAIDPGGVSKFSCYNKNYDADNVAPTISGVTSADQVIAQSADGANAPILTVDYNSFNTVSGFLI